MEAGFAEAEEVSMAGWNTNMLQRQRIVRNEECTLSPLAWRRKNSGRQIRRNGSLVKRSWSVDGGRLWRNHVTKVADVALRSLHESLQLLRALRGKQVVDGLKGRSGV